MTDRYLLYIDVLGFSALIDEGLGKINDLYEVIASLNVHRHDAFKVIVFSDTILVYNVRGGGGSRGSLLPHHVSMRIR